VFVQARAGAGTADSSASGEIATLIGARRIQRRDLLVGAADRATIVVTVTDSGGRPLAGARAYVDEAAPVEVNASGRGVLRDVAAGTRTVGARFIGYTPTDVAVDATADDTARVVIPLRRAPPMLETVYVRGLLGDLEARRALGRGHVMMGEALARAPTLSYAVPMSPRVRNQSRAAGALDILVLGGIGMNWCQPKVLLDGRLSDMSEISMYRTDQLLAVELYENPKDAPAQYVRPSDYNCGVLLVWTKRR
jgi:hypothetical protein